MVLRKFYFVLARLDGCYRWQNQGAGQENDDQMMDEAFRKMRHARLQVDATRYVQACILRHFIFALACTFFNRRT